MKKFMENLAVFFGLWKSYLVQYKLVDSTDESNAIVTLPAWKVFPLNQMQDEIAEAKQHSAGIVITSIKKI